ncbi:MAG: hypothetical protein RJA63_1666 [Pseudomonadota bacterium]|jgi:hypothetical protein
MKDSAMTWRKWEVTRAKGEKRFVWVNGVLGWGLLTATLFSAFMVGFNDASWATILVAFLIFPAGGYFWGVAVWRIAEGQYAKDRAAAS